VDSEKPHDTDPAVADTAASDPGPTTTPDGAAAAAPAGRGLRTIRPGDTLGRYEIGEEIGEGGMAIVFRARDKELRRDVAVKVLFPHLARRTEVVRRFHREARAAAGLEHANILRIYDVGGGEGEDPPYIVMELIRGRTLLQEIEQRGAMLAELAACIGALLADALAAAHRAGIIHRDIKPSNVLVAQGGRLLLADFGVARLETEDSLVTRTGSLLGTPAYMSPEQASGDTATARSDLYSLGATLYQLSTGLLPYSGSPAKVMSQIAAGAFVAPIRRRASVGPDLSRAIERLMETDPALRPDTASGVASELRKLATVGGLAGDPAEELAAYFADPAAFLRERTPAIVGAIIGDAKRALGDAKLPRALALADRASALAPDDPNVVTLVDTVMAGGRASRRRKLLALAGAGVLVAGGAAAAGVAFVGRGAAGSDAPALAAIADASVDAPGSAAIGSAAIGSAAIDATTFAADAAPPIADAAPLIADARARTHDAQHAPLAVLDAAVAIDAEVHIDSPPPLVPDAAPAGEGTIAVTNDTWCAVAIDGIPRGQITRSGSFRVPVGPHRVVCTQSGLANKTWTRNVDVVADRTVSAAGTMVQTVVVTIAIAADAMVLDNSTVTRGATKKIRAGRYRAAVQSGDSRIEGWVDIPDAPACRLHEVSGGFACDP
jgi:eukaryotic-like serine/threonine-protein kinase